ncbi:MAG: hypothetical protein RRC34_12150 [Lentisphaeria bacterium]|nr:hypothetical protein [Lentisphaeria bacterium]
MTCSIHQAVPADFPVPGKYAGVDLPVIGQLHLWRAEEPADLLDDPRYIEQFDQCNELMPYWADLWPSSLALAQYLIDNRQTIVKTSQALELGAGLGLAGLTLAKLGVPVVLTDTAEDAREILRIHLRENGLHSQDKNRVMALDFFNPGMCSSPGPDLIIGADILFEERNCGAVAATLSRLLGRTGRALIADPFRKTAEIFSGCLERNGLQVTETILEPPARKPKPTAGVRLFTVCRDCF